MCSARKPNRTVDGSELGASRLRTLLVARLRAYVPVATRRHTQLQDLRTLIESNPYPGCDILWRWRLLNFCLITSCARADLASSSATSPLQPGVLVPQLPPSPNSGPRVRRNLFSKRRRASLIPICRQDIRHLWPASACLERKQDLRLSKLRFFNRPLLACQDSENTLHYF